MPNWINHLINFETLSQEGKQDYKDPISKEIEHRG
jgi:hypothetical protein